MCPKYTSTFPVAVLFQTVTKCLLSWIFFYANMLYIVTVLQEYWGNCRWVCICSFKQRICSHFLISCLLFVMFLSTLHWIFNSCLTHVCVHVYLWIYVFGVWKHMFVFLFCLPVTSVLWQVQILLVFRITHLAGRMW